jgi:hypothetical protein
MAILLFILAVVAFLFWAGEQREGAILNGWAMLFGSIVVIVSMVYLWNAMP